MSDVLYWWSQLSGTSYGLFGLSTIAILALVATVYGLEKHRSRSNLWWIIACAVVSVIALVIPVRLLLLWFVCATQGCDMG
jgi:hypothetical protein